MGKKLTEMTLEELWRLFPICLTEHKPYWREWYFEEEDVLKTALPQVEKISHIGSTAVASIWAKPIVDILVEVAKADDLLCYKNSIEHSGYVCMSQSSDRVSFNKGYTENGFAERVFHLHVRVLGDHDELYFRDYLIAHPDTAKQYEKIKFQLWKKYEYNRDRYTNGKTEFVEKYTEIAKRIYAERYGKFRFEEKYSLQPQRNSV